MFWRSDVDSDPFMGSMVEVGMEMTNYSMDIAWLMGGIKKRCLSSIDALN